MYKNFVDLVKGLEESKRILICGKSGYGKSTLIKECIRELNKTYDIYVHDIKKEYTDYPVSVFYDIETLQELWDEKLLYHQQTGITKKMIFILDEIRELKDKELIETINSVGRGVGITTIGIVQKVVSKITYFIDAADIVVFFNTNFRRIKNSYFRLSKDEINDIENFKTFEYKVIEY